MKAKLSGRSRSVAFAYAACVSLTAIPVVAQDAPIVQPGAPGSATRELTAQEAVKIADTRFSPDDVRFMQDMIPHHHQAVQMAALVKDRTNNEDLSTLAGKIDATQADEIEFMQGWLRDRGQNVPDPAAHHAMHMSHKMAGMASPEDMAKLATLEGVPFDRLFLELMIAHHDGAVKMAEELLIKPGSAYDPVLFEFVNDVIGDQTAEIERMNSLLADLSEDPRAALTAGLTDAGEAAMNLTLVAALPKPDGFFDPANPAQLPPPVPSGDDGEDDAGDDIRQDDQDNEDTEWGSRSPLLSFSNTDMAFAGDVLVAGSYHGFNVYKLARGEAPELFSSVVCPGGQGDVSVVGDLLIMSVEQTRGRVDCGLQGVSEDVSPERFRGIRIFDISDLARPRQVGIVQTCRGSHTHSVVKGPEGDGKILVYNSGTGFVRKSEELEGCIGEIAGDNRTALFRIDVIEIPVDDPSKAKIIDSPTVFADPKNGQIAGLWQGGDHGEDTQTTHPTDQCHDITLFPDKKLAAGACSGNGIIFDISNPRKPKRLDAVTDKGFAYWHSATFNNDGTKVLFTDEWGGGSRPRCRTHDPKDWGADAIYDIVDGKLEFRSYFKMPAPQSDKENCVAHNGSIVPVPGRDIFVQAWYQGGLSVIDFTDSSNPVEIAYFDRGPISEEHLILGGYWSAYWYDGQIYATEITRGLDVLALSPSDFLTENEIAAAGLAEQGDVVNPQQQFRVTWPADPVVAMAYVDQLARMDTPDTDLMDAVKDAVARGQSALEAGEPDRRLSKTLKEIAKDVSKGETASHAGLAETLNDMAALLR